MLGAMMQITGANGFRMAAALAMLAMLCFAAGLVWPSFASAANTFGLLLLVGHVVVMAWALSVRRKSNSN